MHEISHPSHLKARSFFLTLLVLLLVVWEGIEVDGQDIENEPTPAEITIKKCSLLSSNCGLCTREEECGYCMTYLRSGDGKAKYDVRLCLAINSSTQLPLTGEKCDSWRMNTCPCPNECSNNGACDGDGICECNYAWTGEDCSVKRPSIVKPGVIIPIAIGTAFLGAAVVVGIQLFGGGARCLERKGPEHERLKEENMPINKQKMVEPIVGDIEDNGTKEIQNPMSLQSEGKKKT